MFLVFIRQSFFLFPETTVDISMLVGKCFVSYEADLNVSVRDYSAQGPDRFYFREVRQIENLGAFILFSLSCKLLWLLLLFVISELRSVAVFLVSFKISTRLSSECFQAYNSESREFEDVPNEARKATYKGKVRPSL
jgi:hypothetical protein